MAPGDDSQGCEKKPGRKQILAEPPSQPGPLIAQGKAQQGGRWLGEQAPGVLSQTGRLGPCRAEVLEGQTQPAQPCKRQETPEDETRKQESTRAAFLARALTHLLTPERCPQGQVGGKDCLGSKVRRNEEWEGEL